MIRALQEAIYSRLAGFAPLTGLLPDHDYGGGIVRPSIFDHVPQADDPEDGSAFPYVVIGEWYSSPNDTDTETGFDTTVTIHTWSRERGYFEAQDVMEQIYFALHRYDDLEVPGYGVSGMHQEQRELLPDPDGITRHGVQRFRIYFEPIIT